MHLRLLGAILAVSLQWWLLDSEIVAVRRGDDVEWLLLSPSGGRMVVAVLVAAIAVALLCRVLRARDGVAGRSGTAGAQTAAVLGVLMLLLWSAAPLICFEVSCGDAGPVLAYLFFDLRWWFTGAVALLCLLQLSSLRAGPLVTAARITGTSASHTLRRHFTRRWPAYVAAAAAMAGALAMSPQNRFDTVRLTGDEPKYMRHAENLLQGNGFDMTGLQPFDARPRAALSALAQSAAMLPAALWHAGADLGTDLADRLAGRPRSPSRFRRRPNWFVVGQHGGRYEVHNPGLAALLLPAYALDRAVAIDPRPDGAPRRGQGSVYFPPRLTYSSLAMLAMYVAWAAVSARFFHRATGRGDLALVLTAATIFTLPVAPFNYQFYPEVPAGLIVMTAAGYLAFGSRRRLMVDVALGAAVGYLPWLHSRYSLVALALIVWAVVTFRRDRGRMLSFIAGCAALLVPLGLYYYGISGSLLPTAMYGRRARPFAPWRVGPSLMGFMFDRHYGVLSNAPIFFVALPGLCLLLGRQPGVFALLASLVIVSGSHFDWHGGASGPARLIVAVVPLLGLAMAYSFEQFRGSLLFRMLAGVLLVISLDNMAAYGPRSFPSLVLNDASISGWKVNLLFPTLLRRLPSTTALLRAEVLFSVALIALPALRALWRRAFGGSRPVFVSPAAVFSMAVGLFCAAAVGLGLWQPERYDPRFVERPGRSVSRAARAYLERGGYRAFSSWHGAAPTLAGVDQLSVTSPPVAPVNRMVSVRVSARGPASQPVWGEVTLDFGDGEGTRPRRIVGRQTFAHAYRKSGTYNLTASFRTQDGTTTQRTVRQRVRAARVPSG
jgi:hypothetical protein